MKTLRAIFSLLSQTLNNADDLHLNFGPDPFEDIVTKKGNSGAGRPI